MLFSCVNFVGYYHSHLLDIAQRRTFLDTRSCIESRIKLEHEQEQQVRDLTKSQGIAGGRGVRQGEDCRLSPLLGIEGNRVSPLLDTAQCRSSMNTRMKNQIST